MLIKITSLAYKIKHSYAVQHFLLTS